MQPGPFPPDDAVRQRHAARAADVAALVALRADGDGYAGIESAYLATRTGCAVDDARSTRDLLDVIAPGVPLHVTSWS